MAYDFLCRIGRAAQIFGLVIVSACFSSQSLASPPDTWTDLGSATGDLNINQNSPSIIDYSFTINTIKIPQELGNHQASITSWYGSELETLKTLVADNTVTLSNGTSFELDGLFSGSFDTTGEDITFTIKFSKAEVFEWLQDTGKKNILFYPVIFSNDSQKYYYSTVTLDFLKDAYAHISGLEDIELPQPKKSYMGFCVSSTTESVRLEFEAANSTNAFQLKASDSENSYDIDYKITLADNESTKTKTINTPGVKGHKWDAHPASSSGMDCNGSDNMKLRIDFKDQQEADDAPSGTYKDTITITVSPTSK